MIDYRNTIKRWMTEAGVSYDELATRLGCSKNAAYSKVSVTKEAQYDSIIKVANALGYKEVLVKTGEDKQVDISQLMLIAEKQRISFRAVEAVLECVGYELDFVKRW